MKKKIFISCKVIRDQGGISTSVLNLLHNIHQRYDVTLCVLTGSISKNVNIPSSVKIIFPSKIYHYGWGEWWSYTNYSSLQKILIHFWRFVRFLIGPERFIEMALKRIKINEKYDAALAFYSDTYNNKGIKIIGGDFDLVAKCVKAKRKVAFVHNNPYELCYKKDICLKLFYNYDSVVNVSYECKKIYDSIVPEHAKTKSSVIYNTYNIEEIKTKSLLESNPFSNDGKVHLLTVSRLDENQKKISRIIKAADRLQHEGITNFVWLVVGGGDKEIYEQMIKERNLENYILLVGLKLNPYPYMRHADAFVLTSRFEGFGMTVREAQILGTPAFVTDFGPADEIIDNGINGEICPNSSEGVYEMIKGILLNTELIKKYKKNLSKSPITNDIALSQFNRICCL